MGMPTLKRFAQPLDWAGIDAGLRGYARKVRKAHAENPGQQARCGAFLQLKTSFPLAGGRGGAGHGGGLGTSPSGLTGARGDSRRLPAGVAVHDAPCARRVEEAPPL